MIGTGYIHLAGPTHWWTACNLSAVGNRVGDRATCPYCIRGEDWPANN